MALATREGSASSSQTNNRPSPLACDECRKRHLKCSAGQPVCERCVTEGLECKYTPSRRGGLSRDERRKRKGSFEQRSRPPPPAPLVRAESSQYSSLPVDEVVASRSIHTGCPSNTAGVLPDRERDHLINLFYSNFHSAHPILVPRSVYWTQAYPDYLTLVVCYIGSHYASACEFKESLRADVANANAKSTERNAHRVQALVLYAIVMHAQQQSKEATTCIAQAVEIALEIGLNQHEPVTDMVPSVPYAQESLRRTWWELYVVDGFMAAAHQQPSFRSDGVSTHAYLPSEELLYAQGVNSFYPTTIEQFQDRVFTCEACEKCSFSSYSYRIEAIRIMARVLAVADANDAEPDEVQAVDNALASWKYHLPQPKQDVIDQYGRVDQMLFQANVFMQCATILLHFPRSDLPLTVPTTSDLACARDLHRVSATSKQHTVKAIAASKELCNLAALPWCVNVYTPFFTCGLILGCIVQLSASSSHARTCLQQHRDRVSLMMGALKALGEKWAVARTSHHHLGKVSHAIFCSKPVQSCSPVPCSSAHDSGVDVGGGGGDVSWMDLFFLDEMGMEAQGFGQVAHGHM